MLRSRINAPGLTLVPVVFNAMCALLARRAGFVAGYVGGASLGYLRGSTEAAMTPQDFASVGQEIALACPLPLIADAGCGWGDPVHMHRYVPLLEVAGYAALEIEDQVVPKRVHHHVGIEQLVSTEEMAAKITEAARARRNPDTIIIARTNTMRHGADVALRRCEVYAKAGADLLFPVSGDIELLGKVGNQAPLPLMVMVHPGQSFAAMGVSHDELTSFNCRLLVDGITPFAAMFEALSRNYSHLAASPAYPGVLAAMEEANDLVGLPALLSVERQTTERSLA